MTNVEYLEMVEKEIRESSAFTPEFKISMYMRSIARSLAVIADSEKQESKWIPVSERLPEDRDWYLAVFKEKDSNYQLIPRVAECINDENNWRMIDEEAFSKEYLDILECVAWMPLPKPYKEKTNE